MGVHPDSNRYRFEGRWLEVSHEPSGWRVRVEGQDVVAPHLDHALAELLNLPSPLALRLALAIFNADSGDDLSA